jgi:hypothetical protein
MNVPHQFLRFAKDTNDTNRVRFISVALLNWYLGKTLCRKDLKKLRRFTVPWTQSTHDAAGKVNGRVEHVSQPLSVEIFDEHIQSRRTFDFQKFGLDFPRCVWLDFSLPVAMNFQAITIQVQSPLGETYPYHPILDREGSLYTDVQGILFKRIKALRHGLVETSANLGTDAWVEGLRSLVSECVSLIDGTLHQIYYRAEFGQEPGWTFDRDALGSRIGRNLDQKMGWVFKITGQHIDVSAVDRQAFNEIKALRNHLQHFDPPSFCYTLEDAAGWLNLVPSVARLNLAIRKCVGAGLSVPLIEMLLEQPVQFFPMDPAKVRPLQDKTGYASVRAKPEPPRPSWDERRERQLDAEQDATLALLDDEGVARLLEKQHKMHERSIDRTTRAALRSAARRLQRVAGGTE